MTCWIAIPIKSPDACKTRLYPALGKREHERLVSAMLHHVMTVTMGAEGDNRLLLLAPCGHDVPAVFERVVDNGNGLNAELSRLLNTASASDAERLVIMPADLPWIAGADVECLTDQARGRIAIAPDRAGLGTNALSLPLPAARDFRFQFGEGSFERHRAEAARLALPLTIVRSERLAFDVDEPADLKELQDQNFVGSANRPRATVQYLEGGVVGSK